MKKVIIFSIAMIMLTACEKDDTMPIYFPGDTTHGMLHALRNGKEWTASGLSGKYYENKSFIGINATTYTDSKIIREIVYISSVPLQKGYFAINGTKESYNSLDDIYVQMLVTEDDGCATEDHYYLAESPKSYIEITHLDTINNKVAGNFEVYLAVEQPKRGYQNADELRFKHGSFELDIIE